MPNSRHLHRLVREMEDYSIRALDDQQKRFELSFSSEAPVSRWGVNEILSHADGAVQLERLMTVGTVLFNHNRDKVIAKIVSAAVENGRGIAEIEFDDDEESERIRQKVAKGSIRGVSVGCHVSAWETVKLGARSSDGRFDGPAEIATQWEPVEISIASVPADPAVGVGREEGAKEPPRQTGEDNMPNGKNATGIESGAQQREDPQQNASHAADDEAMQRGVETEHARNVAILDLCRSFDVDASPYIRDAAMTVEQVQQDILGQLATQRRTATPQLGVDERDKYLRAASDALVMRSGIAMTSSHAGADELRGMSLQRMAIDAMSRFDGRDANSLLRMDPAELMRQFLSPTSVFPAILDDAFNKSYRKGYEEAPSSYQYWTAKGTLPDFKATGHEYRQGAFGEFELVPEGGEIKHDIPKDELVPPRKLDTYGKQITMTRQAFINDDIGFVTTIPMRLGSAARLTINAQVYGMLHKNPVMIDGNRIFSAAHNNTANAAGALTLATLQEAILALSTQKGSRERPLNIRPRFLVVPVGLGIYANMLLKAQTLRTVAFSTGEAEVNNPLLTYGIEVVEDAELDAGLTTAGEPYAWFLAADPNQIDTIQVDYYNGIETPQLIRHESIPGQLGMIWDAYLDWGVTVLDYKGMYKNGGAKPNDL